MRTFTDTQARKWNLDITVGAVKRVKEGADVLLTDLFSNDCKLLGELSTDVIKLVEVLWVLCERKAESFKVTPEEFAEGLGGDTLGEAGEALVRATADFFPSPEQRQAMHAMLDKLNVVATNLSTATEKMVGSLDASQLAENCLRSAMSTRASRDATRNPEPLVNST